MSQTITLDVRCDGCGQLMAERGVWPYYTDKLNEKPTLAVRFLCEDKSCLKSLTGHKKFPIDIPFIVEEVVDV